MKNLIISIIVLLSLNTFVVAQNTVTDIDGNVYKTVTIGSQVWMAENLRVTHYSNGDVIPNLTDNYQWDNTNSGAYCFYDNDTNKRKVYGALYNLFAVKDSRGIAPLGWHVSSDSDWTVLGKYLGGDSIAGGKLKEKGTAHWSSPNYFATDDYGFAAVGGGYRPHDDGVFGAIDTNSYFWTSTSINNQNITRDLYHRYSNIRTEKGNGSGYEFSVRLVKNTNVGINDLNLNNNIQISPNPAQDFLTISGKLKVESYKVFDITGKEVIWGSNNNTINISQLKKGIYFIRVVANDNKTYNSKFVKN